MSIKKEKKMTTKELRHRNKMASFVHGDKDKCGKCGCLCVETYSGDYVCTVCGTKK